MGKTTSDKTSCAMEELTALRGEIDKDRNYDSKLLRYGQRPSEGNDSHRTKVNPFGILVRI